MPSRELAPVMLRWLCFLPQELTVYHCGQCTHTTATQNRVLKGEWALGQQRTEVMSQGEGSTVRAWGPCRMKPICRDHLVVWFGVGKQGRLPETGEVWGLSLKVRG